MTVEQNTTQIHWTKKTTVFGKNRTYQSIDHLFHVSFLLTLSYSVPVFALSIFLHSLMLEGSALVVSRVEDQLILQVFLAWVLIPVMQTLICLTQHHSFWHAQSTKVSESAQINNCNLFHWGPSSITLQGSSKHGSVVMLLFLLILGTRHSLAWRKTFRMYILWLCPCMVDDKLWDVKIGNQSINQSNFDPGFSP